MTTRRISIHDYPEHLNPFNEFYNDGLDVGHRNKYYTWSTVGKHKIKHAISEKPWSVLTPSKLGRRLSFIKAITIDKLSPGKGKQKVRAVQSAQSVQSTAAKHDVRNEPFLIISPKQKEKMKRLAMTTTNQEQGDSNVALTLSSATSTLPTRRKLSLQENDARKLFIESPSSHIDSSTDDGVIVSTSSPENEQSHSVTGARPKPRKKRAAPPPPQQGNVSLDMESTTSSHEEAGRSVSPDDSITQILEQDAILHYDSEHNEETDQATLTAAKNSETIWKA